MISETVDVQPLILISAWRPRHLSAPKDVRVKMMHGLARGGSGVDDHAVAVPQSLLPGYLSCQG